LRAECAKADPVAAFATDTMSSVSSTRAVSRYAGGRVIDDAEAAIVRRIFEAFATGKSPRAIARELNAERIPGPGGRPWSDTTIRGHTLRRTGILHNELYIGRLVWNKQRYVKEPSSGKRLAPD